jgi:hypothetical protein
MPESPVGLVDNRFPLCYEIGEGYAYQDNRCHEREGDLMSEKIVNGVNVTAVEDTVKAIEGQPDIANFKFRISNKWISGGHNHSTVGDFFGANQENAHEKTHELDADEPPILAGTDRGANPVEHLLNALAACLKRSWNPSLRGTSTSGASSVFPGT